MGPQGQLLLPVTRFLLLTFLQRLESPLLRGKQQFRKMFVTQRRVHKENNQRGERRHHHISQTSQPLPAGTSRIVEDRFGHGELIAYRMLLAAHGQFSAGQGRSEKLLISKMQFPPRMFTQTRIFSPCSNWCGSRLGSFWRLLWRGWR